MGLAERIGKAPVSELNLREMPRIESGATVRDAVQVMRQAGLGCAMVMSDDKPVGMFTEGILREAFAENPQVIDDPVTDHLAASFPKVYLDDTIDMVLSAMQVNNTRFICVVDSDENVVGLTGQKGLMEFVAEEFPRQVMVQRIGGEAVTGQREGA
ncbi:MAG: CBS domain-containing protein [Planctomycetaceae bacterium]|nr:CBS domain-containing protein [Planctomycetaceae bacterium]